MTGTRVLRWRAAERNDGECIDVGKMGDVPAHLVISKVSRCPGQGELSTRPGL